MRTFLRAPLSFILFLILFTVLSVGMALVYRLADFDWHNLLGSVLLTVVAQDVLTFAVPLIALAAVIALFANLTLLRFRFFAALTVFILATAALFGAFRGWQTINKTTIADPPHRLTLLPNVVYQPKGAQMIIGAIDGNKILDIVFRPVGPDQKIAVGRQAVVDPKQGSITVSDWPHPIPVAELYATADALYDLGPDIGEDARIAQTVRDFLGALMTKAAPSMLDSIIFAVGFGLAIVSIWFWVRCSRWPLWNGLAALFFLIALGYGWSVLVGPQGLAVMTMLASIHPLASVYAIPISAAVFAIIWLVGTIFLLPLPNEKRGADW